MPNAENESRTQTRCLYFIHRIGNVIRCLSGRLCFFALTSDGHIEIVQIVH